MVICYPLDSGYGMKSVPIAVIGDGDGKKFVSWEWLWYSNNRWLVSLLSHGASREHFLSCTLQPHVLLNPLGVLIFSTNDPRAAILRNFSRGEYWELWFLHISQKILRWTWGIWTRLRNAFSICLKFWKNVYVYICTFHVCVESFTMRRLFTWPI